MLKRPYKKHVEEGDVDLEKDNGFYLEDLLGFVPYLIFFFGGIFALVLYGVMR